MKIHSCFIRSNGSASNKESEQFVHKVIELYQEGSDTESISKVSAKGSTENPKVNISIAALHDTSRLASGKSASSFENDGQADLLNKKEKILKNIYELNERGGIFLDEPKI